MHERLFWENGERVPVYDPRDDSDDYLSAESKSLKMMRRLLGNLKASPDPALTIDCLCLITGLCYDGQSMAQIARRHLVSRATVSNRCVELCETFGIEPTRAMRGKAGRENCRKARFKKVEELTQ